MKGLGVKRGRYSGDSEVSVGGYDVDRHVLEAKEIVETSQECTDRRRQSGRCKHAGEVPGNERAIRSGVGHSRRRKSFDRPELAFDCVHRYATAPHGRLGPDSTDLGVVASYAGRRGVRRAVGRITNIIDTLSSDHRDAQTSDGRIDSVFVVASKV